MLNEYIAKAVLAYKESILFHISYLIGFYIIAKWTIIWTYRIISDIIKTIIKLIKLIRGK